MDKQLTDNFQPLDNSILEQNALVVNTGDKLILFDTGLGTLHLFGPTTGRLLNSLKQAGIDPKDIDAVVMPPLPVDRVDAHPFDDWSPALLRALIAVFDLNGVTPAARRGFRPYLVR